MKESFEGPTKMPEPLKPVVERKKIDEIALRAAEIGQFKKIVSEAPNRLEAVRSVRGELRKHFPEIDEIQEPKPGPGQVPIGGLVSNEFLVAKEVVNLLWEKK